MPDDLDPVRRPRLFTEVGVQMALEMPPFRGRWKTWRRAFDVHVIDPTSRQQGMTLCGMLALAGEPVVEAGEITCQACLQSLLLRDDQRRPRPGQTWPQYRLERIDREWRARH